jgi:nitrite reductase/ring-hydroxylating ferredoxin subunit
MTTHDSCGGACGRRDFLRGSATVIALTALFGRDAAALPVEVISALRRSGTNVTYPLPTADGVTIDRDQDVIVARSGGRVMAFALTCPHQNTALRWQEKAGEFQCPKHKSRYKPDGQFIAGRATRAMDRFAVRRDGASLIVDVDRLFKADEQPAEWAAAVLQL